MTNIDYGAIIKRSWDLTWKKRWLWVYGLVLAAFASGSSFSNFNSFRNSGSSSSSTKSQIPADLPQQGAKVMGGATNALASWMAHVSPWMWVLLVFAVLVSILVYVLIVWVLSAWAKGALISGLDDADKDKEVNLLTTSPKGLSNAKNLIILSLISFGISFLVLISAMGIFGIGLLVFSVSGLSALAVIWGIIVGIAAFLTIVVAMVLIGMLGVYADRLIVLHHYSPWQAWKKGLSLSKNNFLATALMGLINAVLGCGIGCLSLVLMGLLIVPVLVIFIPLLAVGGILAAGPGAVVAAVFGLLLFIFAATYISVGVRAIMVVFNYATWNQLFRKVMEDEHEA